MSPPVVSEIASNSYRLSIRSIADWLFISASGIRAISAYPPADISLLGCILSPSTTATAPGVGAFVLKSKLFNRSTMAFDGDEKQFGWTKELCSALTLPEHLDSNDRRWYQTDRSGDFTTFIRGQDELDRCVTLYQEIFPSNLMGPILPEFQKGRPLHILVRLRDIRGVELPLLSHPADTGHLFLTLATA
jgi:hypothetical protein